MMKHIVIKSVGPITEADIILKQLNVIIGPQSLGKSTVLKIASYCTWVEKRIELTQNYTYFAQEDRFIKDLVEFHKLDGYIHTNTFIEYESDFMKFSYDNKEMSFQFTWKERRWEYKRPKVSYIPSERNLVAAIPNWYEVSMGRNNIRSFMTDWETARQATASNLRILDLDISYHYEADGKKDKVQSHESNMLDFTNTSSGLQSLIPLYVYLNYLFTTQYKIRKDNKIKGDWENEELLRIIYKELFENKGRTQAVHSIKRENENGVMEEKKVRYMVGIGPLSLIFSYPSDGHACQEIYNRYQTTDHCEVFLEEPENNLFPPTQDSLTKWLIDKTLDERDNTLFIATHSPYVLASIVEERNIPLSLYFVYEKDGMSLVKTASEEEVKGIFDYGIDAFFNLDNLVG